MLTKDTVFLLDIDAGKMRQSPLTGLPIGRPGRAMRRGNSVVFTWLIDNQTSIQQSRLYVVPDDFSKPAKLLTDRLTTVLPSVNPDRVWVLDEQQEDLNGDPTYYLKVSGGTIRELDLEGQATVRERLLPEGYAFRDVTDTGLVGTKRAQPGLPGLVDIWNPISGVFVQHIADNAYVVAASAMVVAWLESRFVEIHLTSTGKGESRIVKNPAMPFAFGGLGVISPDGRYLLAHGVERRGATARFPPDDLFPAMAGAYLAVDIEMGTVIPAEATLTPEDQRYPAVWSSSGKWAFVCAKEGISALRPDRSGSRLLAVAIPTCGPLVSAY